MKVEKHVYCGVDEKGRCPEGGAVHTGAVVKFGFGNGCGIEGCNCSEGYWILIGLPRTKDGVVEGLTVYFDNREEMVKCFQDSFSRKKIKQKDLLNKFFGGELDG